MSSFLTPLRQSLTHLPNPPLPPSAVSEAPLWLTVLPLRETYTGQAPSPHLELRSWKPLLFGDSVNRRNASPGGIGPGVSEGPPETSLSLTFQGHHGPQRNQG